MGSRQIGEELLLDSKVCVQGMEACYKQLEAVLAG